MFEIQTRLVRFRNKHNSSSFSNHTPTFYNFFDSYSVSFKGMSNVEFKLKDFDKSQPYIGNALFDLVFLKYFELNLNK